MDEKFEREMEEYLNEVMPKIISAMLQNEIVKKQMNVQERIASALEALVELKKVGL